MGSIAEYHIPADAKRRQARFRAEQDRAATAARKGRA